MKSRLSFFVLLLLSLVLTSSSALADDDEGMYRVTITNLTHGETFTPIMVVSHKKGLKLFQLGQAGDEALARLAEGGDDSALVARLRASAKVYATASSGALLAPGASVSVEVAMRKGYDRISVASMLIPTNDAFIAVQDVKPARRSHARQVYAIAYDAGSEYNSELCADIPGPVCGGEGYSSNAGEGFVHVHNGIHGQGDLSAAEYDWRNPSALVRIERIR